MGGPTTLGLPVVPLGLAVPPMGCGVSLVLTKEAGTSVVPLLGQKLAVVGAAPVPAKSRVA